MDIDATDNKDGGVTLGIDMTVEEYDSLLIKGIQLVVDDFNKSSDRKVVVVPVRGTHTLGGSTTVELSDEDSHGLVSIAVEDSLSKRVVKPNKAAKSFVDTPDVYDKVWGREIWLSNSKDYCGKILELNERYRCSIHYHKKKNETFHILSGVVYMELNGRCFKMLEGSTVTVPAGTEHRFTGIVDSRILEISTQHFEDDSYRCEVSGSVKDEDWDEFLLEVDGVKILTKPYA